jgi:hypothetical protein
VHYVIGCGGVGSWLVPKLTRLLGSTRRSEVTLIDGDTLEERNLDRQLFGPDDIGRNKAEALADAHGGALGSPQVVPRYFHGGMEGLSLGPDDLLWCCADNHACRREVLSACDQYDCRTVFGANEYLDSEAYWYEPNWRDTANDPRVFYPTILTDNTGDPLGPPGCTGQAQERSPQLVIANDAASTLATWLYWFHFQVRPGLPRTSEVRASWPVMHRINKWRTTTVKYGDRLAAQADAQTA